MLGRHEAYLASIYWAILILERLQVVSNPTLEKSGVYWSWNKANGSFENELSEESSDTEKARKLWDVSLKLVGLA